MCLAELPGVSGTPLGSGNTYPRAQEVVGAFERFAARVLGLSTLDGIAHSAGAHVLSYAALYAPTLFHKVVYVEVRG